MNNQRTYTTTRKVAVQSGTFFAGMSIEEGKQARIQEQRKIIGERITTLKNLAYDSLAGKLVPPNRAKCLDIYHNGVETIRQLGREGGPQYDHLTSALKYMWLDETNATFKEVEKLLTGTNR